MAPPASAPVSDMSSFCNPGPDANKLIAFLKEYKVLECSCCSNVFGFQHKTTGILYCIDGCHERSPPTASKMMLSPMFSLDQKQVSPISSSVEPKRETQLTADAIDGGMARSSVPPVSKVENPLSQTVKSSKVETPEPVESKLPKAVPSTVKPPVAPATPKPEPPKPVAVASAKYLWSDMKYSEKLICPDAQVRVQFAWTPVTYTVVADADEAALSNLQIELKTYASTAKPMEQVPEKDEMVIGEYDGEYYRARVMNINGTDCDIVFVDFGDKKTCKPSEIIPINGAIMKHPVYGMMVTLKMPVDASKIKISDALEALIYGEAYVLDMKKNVRPAPGQTEQFEVRMWDLEKENTLNEKITVAATNSTHCWNWSPLTPEEQDELESFMKISSHLKATKDIVEESMNVELVKQGLPCNYTFRLDNADFTYKIGDLPLIKAGHVKNETLVEITKFNALNSVTAVPLGEPFSRHRNNISDKLQHWMESRNTVELRMLQSHFIPEFDEMCIVQWPDWVSLNSLMEKVCGNKWKSTYFTVEQRLDIFKDDYDNYSGKWFRAACASSTNPRKYTNNEEVLNIAYEMFLVDIGKTTLIPTKFVYRMPHRFMIDYQSSLFLSIQLDDIIQYDDTVDEKWKYLILPGMKIIVKFVWMFDEINIVRLIDPSENEFEKHFLLQSVQEGIEKYEEDIKVNRLQQKARKISKLKGTFPKNMERVLAEEGEEEKLKPLKMEYAGNWRVHPDRIFQLCLP